MTTVIEVFKGRKPDERALRDNNAPKQVLRTNEQSLKLDHSPSIVCKTPSSGYDNRSDGWKRLNRKDQGVVFQQG